MKVILLAGGLGTRISEETDIKPKPMIEIGGKPILWHLMKIYAAHGLNDFIICCGYKGYVIKEYFLNYFYHLSDITIDINSNKIEIHDRFAEPWKITLVDTGENTMTGGRLRRVKKYLDGTFCMTYGDGLADINLSKLIEFHKKHKKLATITGTEPPGRFGALKIQDDTVTGFQEKPKGDNSIINGGFFVLEPEVIDFISDDNTIWEKEPLENLAENNQLKVFKHYGFWQPMDTLRDKRQLEELWMKGCPPWKMW